MWGEKIIYIYKRTNLVNNKVYIGQTIQEPSIRWKAEDRSNQEIGKAVRQFGKHNFLNEIIDTAVSQDELDQKERFWIQYYDANNPNKGYNRTKGGKAGCSGHHHKVIVWDSKKLWFPTQKSLESYLYESQSEYTISQIQRFIRIGLRLHNTLFTVNNQNIVLDLYTVKDYSGNIKDCVKYDKSCKTL